MPQHSLLISERVFNVLQGFSRDERREVSRLLGIIQANPWVDDEYKITYPVPPAVFTAYVTREFWIVYQVSNDLIRVYNVKRAGYYEPIPG